MDESVTKAVSLYRDILLFKNGLDLLISLISGNTLALWVLLVLNRLSVNLDMGSVRFMMRELYNAWLDAKKNWDENDQKDLKHSLNGSLGVSYYEGVLD